jgi:hypothetical protein
VQVPWEAVEHIEHKRIVLKKAYTPSKKRGCLAKLN